MSTLKTNAILDASGGNTATINTYTPTESNMMGKNRIINGDMRIDQRNAGASVTPTASGYLTVDRFRLSIAQSSKFSIQQSSTAPTGFVNSLLATSLSAYTVGSSELFGLQHRIEGTNCSDLAWGSASAKTVTLSFWVYSSLTGTFGGSVSNSAGNRFYIFSYTINAANTWEQKTITIAGDTSGTWLTTTGIGMAVVWSLGAGATYQGTAGSWGATEYYAPTSAVNLVATNGATFYITGVQLEVGSVATPFERRPYGTELQLCQRYYQKIFPQATNIHLASGFCSTTTSSRYVINLPVQMRVAPTALETSGTANQYAVNNVASGFVCNAVPSFGNASNSTIGFLFDVASGLTAGTGALARTDATNGASAYLGWSAEL